MKRGQITVFIIVGIIVLFVFLLLIQLSSSFEKEQLEQQQEGILTKAFYKEGLRLFVEDCLEDELSNGLVLLGKQGRLWDEGGGVLGFENGVTGVQFGEDQVFYGITREDHELPEAYPCDEHTGEEPAFCQYGYPNISVGFGEKSLFTTEHLQEDLTRYVSIKTVECVDSFVKENVSQSAVLVTEKPEVSVTLLPQGIPVQVDYPIRFSVGGEEFFSLASFDFFYPSEFGRFVQKAAVFPMKWDQLFVDFDYSEEVFIDEKFTYGSVKEIGECEGVVGEYFCERALSPYTGGIPVQMKKDEVAGDTVFTFSYPWSSVIASSVDVIDVPQDSMYRFRIARQNRPPALEYEERLSCISEEYDYLVIKGSQNYDEVEISLDAMDPDEDEELVYSFESSLSGVVEGNTFTVSGEALPDETGVYDVVGSVEDEHGLVDSQRIRVLVDRDVGAELSLHMPYDLGERGLYEEIYSPENGYIVSVEDPIFFDVQMPLKSAGATFEETTLTYTGDEEFVFTLSELSDFGGGGCFSFPGFLLGKCGDEEGLGFYGEYVVSDAGTVDDTSKIWNWKTWLNDPSNVKPKTMPTNFFKEVKGGEDLILDVDVSYCSEELDIPEITIPLNVVECLPHKNADHPFPYPYHTVKVDPETGERSEEEINPFLAEHACCGNFEYKKPEEVCYESLPEQGCFGLASDDLVLLSDGNTDLEDLAGYIVEERVEKAYCTGDRGNVCGEGNFESVIVDGGKCGNREAYGGTCNKVHGYCEDLDPWSINEEEKAWCNGPVGCGTTTSVCTTSIVYTGSVPNVFAGGNVENTIQANNQDFQCGGCTFEGQQCFLLFSGVPATCNKLGAGVFECGGGGKGG